MRATVIYGAGDVRVETVPDPKLVEPTDVVLRVVRSCICGSDLWPYADMPPNEHGRRIGHEFLGVVEETGADVTSVKKGDLVVAPFVYSDNTCQYCRRGLHTIAVNAKGQFVHHDHSRADLRGRRDYECIGGERCRCACDSC